jgi:hypothetical protein
VTAGLALEAAALIGMSSTGEIPGADLLATSIFVDGTKSVTGNELGNPPYRMADSFQGRYDNGDDNQFVMYPRSLGPATGLGDPTYDESEGLATEQVIELVKAAKAADPDKKIYVVGYSQGAGGAVEAIPELEKQGLTDNVEFVLAANPRRNDGGILTRFPPGVYVPIFGVTFGDGTTPDSTKVLQVTKQYDGVGDAPKYFLNVAADANAALGYYYLHGDYYKDIDPTPDPNRTDAIVTKTADGNVTDVLVLNQDGQLPLTRPLLQLGVPQNIVSALDPFLRAVIETGYDRPADPNSYPSQPVRFSLVPPPTKWLSDVQSITAGALLTTQRLTTLGQQPATTQIANRSSDTDDKPAGSTKAESEPNTGTASNNGTPSNSGKTLDAGDDLKDLPSDIDEDDPPAAGADTASTQPPKPKPWRPGDLVRAILTPKPKDTTTGPASPPSAGSDDSANAPKTNAESSSGASQ